MAVQTSEVETQKVLAKSKSVVVDCDVHEYFGSAEDLIPYLAPEWRPYITEHGWGRAMNMLPAVTGGRGGIHGQYLQEGAVAGSNLALLRKHLFDELGVDTGILNGWCYVSAQQGQYELAAAIASAYNDWQIDQWLSPEPRLRGSVHVVAHNPEVAAREIDRVAEHPQIVQVFLPAVTDRQYGDPFYAPIFAAAVRHGLVVTLHHSEKTAPAFGYPRTYFEWHALAPPQGMMCQLTSLIANGVFDKFPELKVVVLESGITWLPHVMYRLDTHHRMLRIEVPWLKRMPSSIIREQVRVATQPLETLTRGEFLTFVDQIGSEEVLVFATDYPHWDTDAPRRTLPGGLPKPLVDRVMYKNARETFPRL